MVGRLRSRFSPGYADGSVRNVPETDVFSRTRHYHMMIEQQLKVYFNRFLQIIRAIGGWFVLKERKRRFTQTPSKNCSQFPDLNRASSGEPAKVKVVFLVSYCRGVILKS